MIKKIKNQKHVIRICLVKNCNNQATTDGFCRFHYIKNWKQNHEKEKPTKRNKRKTIDEKKDLCDIDLSDFFTGENYDEDVDQIIHNLRIDD